MAGRARLAYRAGALIGTALALAVGCSVVTSYEGFTPEGPACAKKSFPARPATSDEGTTPDLVGAVTRLGFIGVPDGGTLGYDLDNLCTCPDLQACRNSNAGTDKKCDEPENTGIDNAAGTILRQLYQGDADERIQYTLDYARNGMVVRVRDWNGKPSDATVSVSLYNVVGLKGGADGGAEDGGFRATRNGTDEYIVDQASLANAAPDYGSNFRSTGAYVSNGTLVAAFDAFKFRLEVPIPDAGTGLTAIPLRTAFLVGKIERVGESGLRMNDAQLVGRLTAGDIIAQFAGIKICRNNPNFPMIKAQTCAALDMRLVGSGTSKLACDALSFAVGTPIGPAKLGGSAAAVDPPSVCGVEPPESCN